VAGSVEYFSGIDPADDDYRKRKGPSPPMTLAEGALAVVIETSYFRFISVRSDSWRIG